MIKKYLLVIFCCVLSLMMVNLLSQMLGITSCYLMYIAGGVYALLAEQILLRKRE